MPNLRLLALLALPALIACGSPDAPKDTTEAPATAEPATAEPAPRATEEAGQADPTSHYSVVLDAAASTVEWTSIKNGDAPVKGTFTKVSGGLNVTAADLSATVGDFTFDLNGVDSGLELRDTRISEVFFGSAPDAAKSAEVKLTKLVPATKTLAPGESTTGTAELSLTLSQGTTQLTGAVSVTRVDENTWKVASKEPLKVSIEALNLSAPLAALMKLCAHKSVDDSVAIGLDLTFKAKE